MGYWEAFPTILFKLPQNWVICIEKAAPATLLKLPQSVLEILSINKKMLMKYLGLKFFLAVIWVVANDDNMCKLHSVEFDQ